MNKDSELGFFLKFMLFVILFISIANFVFVNMRLYKEVKISVFGNSTTGIVQNKFIDKNDYHFIKVKLLINNKNYFFNLIGQYNLWKKVKKNDVVKVKYNINNNKSINVMIAANIWDYCAWVVDFLFAFIFVTLSITLYLGLIHNNDKYLFWAKWMLRTK